MERLEHHEVVTRFDRPTIYSHELECRGAQRVPRPTFPDFVRLLQQRGVDAQRAGDLVRRAHRDLVDGSAHEVDAAVRFVLAQTHPNTSTAPRESTGLLPTYERREHGYEGEATRGVMPQLG